VQVGLASDGMRRIQEIAAVTGRFENDRAEIETLWKWDGSNFIRDIGSIGNEEKFSAAGIPLTDWWNKNE
jgi:pilus assembly protein CpaF